MPESPLPYPADKTESSIPFVLFTSFLGLGIAYGVLVAMLYLVDPPEGKLVDPSSYTREDTLAMEQLQGLLPADIHFLPGRHVLDHAGLLHPGTVTALEQSLGTMYRRGPMRVAVVTVPGTGNVAPSDFVDQIRLKWDEAYPDDAPTRQNAVLLLSPRTGGACFLGQFKGACYEPEWVKEQFKGNDSTREAMALHLLRWGLAEFGQDSAIGEIVPPSPEAAAPRPTPLPRLTSVMAPDAWRRLALQMLGFYFLLQLGTGLAFHLVPIGWINDALLLLLCLSFFAVLFVDITMGIAFIPVAIISALLQAPRNSWIGRTLEK